MRATTTTAAGATTTSTTATATAAAATTTTATAAGHRRVNGQIVSSGCAKNERLGIQSRTDVLQFAPENLNGVLATRHHGHNQGCIVTGCNSDVLSCSIHVTRQRDFFRLQCRVNLIDHEADVVAECVGEIQSDREITGPGRRKAIVVSIRFRVNIQVATDRLVIDRVAAADRSQSRGTDKAIVVFKTVRSNWILAGQHVENVTSIQRIRRGSNKRGAVDARIPLVVEQPVHCHDCVEAAVAHRRVNLTEPGNFKVTFHTPRRSSQSVIGPARQNA